MQLQGNNVGFWKTTAQLQMARHQRCDNHDIEPEPTGLVVPTTSAESTVIVWANGLVPRGDLQ